MSADRNYIESLYGDVVAEIVAEVRAQERERIAAEIEAAHRTAPDCCAFDVAARIARRQW